MAHGQQVYGAFWGVFRQYGSDPPIPHSFWKIQSHRIDKITKSRHRNISLPLDPPLPGKVSRSAHESISAKFPKNMLCLTDIITF